MGERAVEVSMGCSRAIPFSEVVHFGADQVHWEYARLLTCESLLDSFGVEQPVAWNKSGICNTSSRPPIENVYIFWSHFVESYSAAELTVQSDRSIAISGHLMALKSCDYICGLWRSSFIQELIWCCHLPRARTDNRIPSWSWISIYLVALNRSPVYAMLSDRQPIAELVNISTSPCGDPFSPVSSAHATIRGPLLEALIPSMGFIQVGQDSLGACESWTLLLDEEHREHILGSTVYILLGGGASQQDSPQRLKGDSRYEAYLNTSPTS